EHENATHPTQRQVHTLNTTRRPLCREQKTVIIMIGMVSVNTAQYIHISLPMTAHSNPFAAISSSAVTAQRSLHTRRGSRNSVNIITYAPRKVCENTIKTFINSSCVI